MARTEQELSLGEALRAVWQEARTAPEQPDENAPPGEQWHFVWRTLFARALTWSGLAFILAFYAVAVGVAFWTGYDVR